MGTMELLGSPTTMAPLLLRNLVSSIFVFFDNSLLGLSQNHKLLHFVRSLLLSSFLFFLRFLPSLNHNHSDNDNKPCKSDVGFSPDSPVSGDGDSGIARALSQLLSSANEIPVSSRKYDVVRSLAERIIDDNEREGFPALREINRTVLSAAFGRTLSQLEEAVAAEKDRVGDVACGGTRTRGRLVEYQLGRAVVRAVRSVGDLVGKAAGGGTGAGAASRSGSSAEKLAAELLWLAQKLAACGFAQEAVWRWASAGDLARLSVSAEPRLQCPLVKLSAFLFKQGKDLGLNEGDESEKEQHKQMKMQMLQSWLPLLCRASYGTDAPVLSSSERAELERVLEETIEMLGEEDQQEKVLTLWLYHFTHCSSSDWPNLRASYARWCDRSRSKLLLNQC